MSLWQPPSLLRALDTDISDLLAALADAAKEGSGGLDNSQIERATILFSHSPFLLHIARADPAFALSCLQGEADQLFEAELHDLDKAIGDDTSSEDLMRILRLARQRVALIVAAADVGSFWTLTDVMTALSRFADRALGWSTAFLLRERMLSGDLAWPRGKVEPLHFDLAAGSGFVILALGKLGAHELNYSSDIDIIALYDQDRIDYRGRKSAADCFVRLIRALVNILQQRTEHGYVFRVDLRLRPDPGATPPALSMIAAEAYYQSVGRNWERAAYIKARAAAGDIASGRDFLTRISPFIWRRTLDFAAIEDVHDVKKRMHEHFKHTGLKIPGHDVKIAPGGIREIEFFVQIQQLALGARDWDLRRTETLEMLRVLHEKRRLDSNMHRKLREAYVYLRTLEHRLQMENDEQRHALPESKEGLSKLAAFMGFASRKDFEAHTLATLTTVSDAYIGLLKDFGASETRDIDLPILKGDALNRALKMASITDKKSALEILERWRSGRYRALKTERARELLEACLDDLLIAFGQSKDAGAALARFDAFLARVPSGVQLFSLFQANHWLFRLLASLMGSAPRLADDLARKPALLDSILDPGFFDGLPDNEDLARGLRHMLDKAQDYETRLDTSRRWLNDMRFEAGIHLLEGLAGQRNVSRFLADLADVVIAKLLIVVQDEFARRHGCIEGGELAVLAMGSYGGRELSYTSDLDLVLIYEGNSDAVSDGKRPLDFSQYFGRLGQHFVTALTALTAEGRLYEIDMRLRPSGRYGPLVVTLQSFVEYQNTSAWTWEHMALTRARVVAASSEFGHAITEAVHQTLETPRESEALQEAVVEMRRKLQGEFGTEDKWSVRYVPGGVVDVEFLVQYLCLKNGYDIPGMFNPDTGSSIDKLVNSDLLQPDDGSALADAYERMQSVGSLLRLCYSEPPAGETYSAEVKHLLRRAAKCASFADLGKKLEADQAFVYGLFKKFLGDYLTPEEEDHGT